TAPAVERRHCNRGQQLGRSPRQVVDAVVLIERGGRNRPASVSASERDCGAERDEGGSRVGGGHGKAARARRGHPADRAVPLHAEADRLPPLVILVVIIAASVEAEVPANRSHVAQVRRRDLLCGLAQTVQSRSAGRVELANQAAERHARAERVTVTVPDLLQLGDLAQADERSRRLLPALYVRNELGSARPHQRVAGAGGRKQVDRFGAAPRRNETEPWQSHHRCATAFSLLLLALSGSFSAFPSPPSHGGGTCNVSGHSIAG